MKRTDSNHYGTRYDFDETLLEKGYFQIDTIQDASYYGNWINPTERKKVSFMEGDLIEIEYENDEEMIKYLEEMNDWEKKYRENEKGIKIDLGWTTKEDGEKIFKRLGLLHLTY